MVSSTDPRHHMTCLLLTTAIAVLLSSGAAWAQSKTEKSFSAIITDAHGVDTEVKNILFYWEDKGERDRLRSPRT